MIGPQDWCKILPFEADASSARLGWAGLEAARYRAAPASELEHPGITHHRLVRAKELLQAETDLSLAEVAARAGFSDQSQFTHHFKRVIGVAPGRFQLSARIA